MGVGAGGRGAVLRKQSIFCSREVIFWTTNPKMTSLLQRMGCFLKKAIFTMVLDMAYPRLILHHKVTC